MHLEPQVICCLRDLVDQGATVPALMHRISAELGLETPQRMIVLPVLMETFCLSLREAQPAAAWATFPDGTASDEKVNEEVMPAIIRRKPEWAKEPSDE